MVVGLPHQLSRVTNVTDHTYLTEEALTSASTQFSRRPLTISLHRGPPKGIDAMGLRRPHRGTSVSPRTLW